MFNRWLSGHAARPTGILAPLVGHWLAHENRAINEAAIQALGRLDGKDVLEIGCGPGWALSRLAASNVNTLAAVDASPEMVAQARRRLARTHAPAMAARCDVRCATAEAMPFLANSIDVAMSVNGVYFWRPFLAGLREIRRVLRPGGRLVLAAELPEAMAALGATHTNGFATFTPHELCALCELAGFLDVAVTAVVDHTGDTGAFCVTATLAGHGDATPSYPHTGKR